MVVRENASKLYEFHVVGFRVCIGERTLGWRWIAQKSGMEYEDGTNDF